MKLVFFIDNGKVIGGGDYAQFKFAEYLAKKGHDMMVYAANKNEFLKDYSNLPNLKLKFRGELPKIIKGVGLINNVWDKFYTNFLVKPYLKQNSRSIDYIIGYLRKSAIKVVKLGEKYGIKTVNFIFENPEWMKQQLGERFLNEYKGKFKKSWENTKEAYQKSNILLPNSDLTRKMCSKWLNKNIEQPIYPGVDTIKNNKKIKEENQIIYIGRLNDYKNVNEIIIALSKIQSPPKLVIVGTGEEEKELNLLSLKLNVNCEFKGGLNDENKFNEIKKSMFMIFPSSFEGFGMPPMEALICGKPCICSNLPTFKEIYKNNVEYFKEHNIHDLVKKIEYLIVNKKYRKKRGEEGKNFILKNYTWEKATDKIEECLSFYKNKEITDFLKSNTNIFKKRLIKDVNIIRKNKSRIIYLVRTDDKNSYIIKLGKNKPLTQRLTQEFNILKQLEKSGIAETAVSLKFINDNKIILVKNYIGERYLEDITKKIIKRLINILKILYKLDFPKLKIRKKKIDNSLEYSLLSMYEFIKFKINQKKNPFKDLDMLFKHMGAIFRYRKIINEKNLNLVHGDLNLRNIIHQKNDLKIIDWESASLGDFALNVSRLISEISNPYLLKNPLKEKDKEKMIKNLSKLIKDVNFLEKVDIYLLIYYYMNFTDTKLDTYSNKNPDKIRRGYYHLWKNQMDKIR